MGVQVCQNTHYEQMRESIELDTVIQKNLEVLGYEEYLVVRFLF